MSAPFVTFQPITRFASMIDIGCGSTATPPASSLAASAAPRPDFHHKGHEGLKGTGI
jgi:hypothetical protein